MLAAVHLQVGPATLVGLLHAPLSCQQVGAENCVLNIRARFSRLARSYCAITSWGMPRCVTIMLVIRKGNYIPSNNVQLRLLASE